MMAFTAAEEIFLKRALPHFLAGKSVEEAMRAVLDDDARIVSAAFDRATSDYFPTPCDAGRSVLQNDRKGDLIVSEISGEVYAKLRIPLTDTAS